MRNVFRELRQGEASKRIHHSVHLDLGAGSFPLGKGGITLDRNPVKKPNVVAGVRDLPFSSGSVDCVSLLEMIEHFELGEQEKILNELARVLKDSGRLVISLPNYSSFMRIPQALV